MSRRLGIVSGLMMAALLTSAAHGGPMTDAQLEINYLLSDVEKSGCEFYRNGIWYDATAAHTHLRNKYEYLLALSSIRTTEDFIEKAATESNITGQAYEVKCNGGAAMEGSRWLRDELARFRMDREPTSLR